MRIKAVLRDTEILQMEPGSKKRILAAATKNEDRVISWPSLLKVMGLTFEQRQTMLEILKDSNLHIWLMNDGEQHLVFLTAANETPSETAYQWQ
ncbi:MAG: hypothetical protein ACFFEF_18075 [Candidatus Thorarchaeota archaeon]